MILTCVVRRNPERAIPGIKRQLRNRSARQKNLSNRSAAAFSFRWSNAVENRGKNGPSVTTSHVFRPNKPRKAFSVLPIWLRNSGFSRRSSRHKPRGGAGGGQPHTAGKMPRSHKLARNFILKAFPPLSLFVQKMCRAVAPQLAS